jgi:hypothetical protein
LGKLEDAEAGRMVRKKDFMMFVAQAAGEYGAASSVVASLVQLIQSGSYWVRTSLREDRSAWIIGTFVLLLCLWIFRRR